MLERLQKIIARAGIASRRHAEQLILSGQVRVNGEVVTTLGSKADPDKDKIEAAGRLVDDEQRRVYLLLNKPPEIVSTLADPEGRKTLRNLLRGLPERVYPVGNLEYAAAGVVFMTNDGDLAANILKKWDTLEQVYHIKVKGMLTLPDLDRLGNDLRLRMQTLRQPDSARGHAANFWYEVTMTGGKMDSLRTALLKENHPIEKVKRVAIGDLSLEGIPRGHYRLLLKEAAESLLADKKPAKLQFAKAAAKPYGKPGKPFTKPNRPYVKPSQRTEAFDRKFGKGRRHSVGNFSKPNFVKPKFEKPDRPEVNRREEDDDRDFDRPVDSGRPPWARSESEQHSAPTANPGAPQHGRPSNRGKFSRPGKRQFGRPENAGNFARPGKPKFNRPGKPNFGRTENKGSFGGPGKSKFNRPSKPNFGQPANANAPSHGKPSRFSKFSKPGQGSSGKFGKPQQGRPGKFSKPRNNKPNRGR
ncbi:MAG TPA: S4 domain-containing protein [Candidatus Acidoferrum sp.]